MLSGLKSIFQNKKLVLGSGSKTRLDLLSQQGLTVTVDPSGAEEDLDKAQYPDPREYVRATCRQKMARMLEKYADKDFDLIITADTVIFDQRGNVFEKPRDAADLQRFLRAFSGTWHTAFTAMSLAFREAGVVSLAEEEDCARVHFVQVPESAIASYGQDCPEVFGMSGGYSVNGPASSFIERIEGDLNAIRGLPLAKLCRALAARYAQQ